MNKKQSFSGVFAIVLTGMAILFFSSEWNRAAMGSRGFIDQGKKFGIAVGVSEDTAKVLLTIRGLRIFQHSLSDSPKYRGENRCHDHEYPDGVTLTLFRDYSWRTGNICVASKDGDVIGISWHYGIMQP